jgi:hypothetical protein
MSDAICLQYGENGLRTKGGLRMWKIKGRKRSLQKNKMWFTIAHLFTKIFLRFTIEENKPLSFTKNLVPFKPNRRPYTSDNSWQWHWVRDKQLSNENICFACLNYDNSNGVLLSLCRRCLW